MNQDARRKHKETRNKKSETAIFLITLPFAFLVTIAQ